MIEPLDRNFGLIIAFILPGFTCICGFSSTNEMISGWLSAKATSDPTIGGFLYIALGSLAMGLIVSAIRWAVIDTAFHWTGVIRPQLNYKKITDNALAYQMAVEYSYRYYQFYSNMAIAGLIFAFCRQTAHGLWSVQVNLSGAVLEVILLSAARDSLSRYYRRAALVLGEVRER